jgi:AraC-like DNA-binding protein
MESYTLDEHLKARIESISLMLLEVASGNFDCQIERSGQEDEMEALGVAATMMAEEMKESFIHRSHWNDAHKNITGMRFVLDNDLTIQTFDPGAAQGPLFDAQELEGKPFADFLTPESKTVWQNLQPQLARHDDLCLSSELSFKTKQTLVLPMRCSVYPLFKGNLLVHAIEPFLHNHLEATEGSRHSNGYTKSKDETPAAVVASPAWLREPDIRKIEELKDHILRDLAHPLSLKELAHDFGINEFKLKRGFKQQYGTTVFRFLSDKRLDKAMLLLENTDTPLKRIAELAGFKSFPHFSKVFKNRFGCCPSEWKKQDSGEKK